MKFLDFTRTFQNLQALATHLLQTIGSKRVANAQTMENNGSIVARAFAFKITNFRTYLKLPENDFETINYHEIEINSKIRKFCAK